MMFIKNRLTFHQPQDYLNPLHITSQNFPGPIHAHPPKTSRPKAICKCQKLEHQVSC